MTALVTSAREDRAVSMRLDRPGERPVVFGVNPNERADQVHAMLFPLATSKPQYER